MLNQIATILHWMMNLFDPPPLRSMTLSQKVGRIVLLSGTLVIGSILVAMLGALGLYLIERGHDLGSTPEFAKGVVIVLTAVVVNTFCVLIIIQLKRADHRLIPPTRPAGAEPVVNLQVTPEQLSDPNEKPRPTE